MFHSTTLATRLVDPRRYKTPIGARYKRVAINNWDTVLVVNLENVRKKNCLGSFHFWLDCRFYFCSEFVKVFLYKSLCRWIVLFVFSILIWIADI